MKASDFENDPSLTCMGDVWLRQDGQELLLHGAAVMGTDYFNKSTGVTHRVCKQLGRYSTVTREDFPPVRDWLLLEPDD